MGPRDFLLRSYGHIHFTHWSQSYDPLAHALMHRLWSSYFYWVVFQYPVGQWESCWETITFS